MTSQKKVFVVTGGEGFIGSNLIKKINSTKKKYKNNFY